MQNAKILDNVRKLMETISLIETIKEDGGSEVAKRFGAITKRFANMIMADGLINALLFAYSKAKYSGVMGIANSQRKKERIKYIRDNNVDTNKVWAVLIWMTIKILADAKFIQVDTNKLEEYDPLKILEKIEEKYSYIVIGYLIKHLELLAKIFDSYSR